MSETEIQKALGTLPRFIVYRKDHKIDVSAHIVYPVCIGSKISYELFKKYFATTNERTWVASHVYALSEKDAINEVIVSRKFKKGARKYMKAKRWPND